MHITLETDYAIRITDILARRKLSESGRLDAKTISEQANIPLRFALKILRKLVAGGLVRSYKGIYGGYELCKELEEISLYNIVEIVEGVYRFSRCLNSDYDCTCGFNGLSCTYQGVFSGISDKVCAELKSFTFDRLIKD